MPLTDAQRHQRERDLCERPQVPPCPHRAVLIVTRKSDPLDSWRYCEPHGRGIDPLWHVAQLKPRAVR